MLITADLSQVPDVRPSIDSGVYEWQVLKIEDKPPGKPETKGRVLHVGLRLVNDERFAGRERNTYVFIPDDKSRADALTPLKRFILACGVPITPGQPINVMDCVGKVLAASIINSTYTDAAGVVKVSDQVDNILIPSERAAKTSSSPAGAAQSSVDVGSVIGGTPA